MKKLTLTAIIASVLTVAASQPAEAFLLPPFKTDFTNSIQKLYTTVKTKVDQAKKKIEESTFIQTAIQYGKGAKEVWDYKNSLNGDFSKIDLRKAASLGAKFKKVEKQKTEAEDKAAQDAANTTREGNQKITEIDKNINELQQDSLDNPKNANANLKKIVELQGQRDQVIADVYEKVNKINEDKLNIVSDLSGQLSNIASQLGGLENKAKSMFTSLAKNYNSTEDLKETISLISPAPDTEITTNIIYAYRKRYYELYWTDLRDVLTRNTIIRAKLLEDNEKAKEDRDQTGTMEGSTAADSVAVVELKKENMQALLNYTELVLQRLKLNISYDLATSSFTPINPDTAGKDFNFDNYRFNPEEEKQNIQKTGGVKHNEGEAIEADIATPSAEAVKAGLKAIAEQAEAEKVDNSETEASTDDKGENR